MRSCAVVLLCCLFTLASTAPTSSANLVINTTAAFADPAPILGYGWEMFGMFSYMYFMTNPAYIAIASHLPNSMVRVGGISADFTTYDLSDSPAELASAETSDVNILRGSDWPFANRNITATHFELLVKYLGAANISLIFDLNELYGRSCNNSDPANPYNDGVWCEGAWDMSNVEAFLGYVHDHIPSGPGATLVAFELGNELVSHLDPVVNVADIKALAAVISNVWADVPPEQRPAFFAPSTDNCEPTQLEIMVNITGVPGVTGFTYHSYPGGSGLPPHTLTSLLLNSTWLRTSIAAHDATTAPCLQAWNAGPRAEGLQLLVTESSSSWNWTLPPPAQNSFLHGFYSIPEWGQYAQTGVSFVARWAFSESSPFALIVQNGSRFDVAHDYWLLLLHKQLAGSAVLNSTGTESSDVLAYAYCSRSVANGTVVVVAVNPSSVPVTLSFSAMGTLASIPAVPRWEYVFTAPGGDLGSTTPVLNGNEGEPLRVGEDGSLPPLPGAYVDVSGPATVTMPPLSQAFYVLLGASSVACS
jgi:hypothetical protein